MKYGLEPTMRSHVGLIRAGLVALVLGSGPLALSACSPTQEFVHGAVITQDQIDLIPVGSSKDQVLLALGTPSTTGEFESEVFYYISQRAVKRYAYDKQRIVDQRILSVYFDETDTVTRVANYGLQDGKVFDFISRTTPTGGRDLSLLGQILMGGTKNIKPQGPLEPMGTSPGTL